MEAGYIVEIHFQALASEDIEDLVCVIVKSQVHEFSESAIITCSYNL
jgi:hypothetical protein